MIRIGREAKYIDVLSSARQAVEFVDPNKFDTI